MEVEISLAAFVILDRFKNGSKQRMLWNDIKI